MSLVLVALVALIAWLSATRRLPPALLHRLIAGGIGLLALRLGFTGSPLGGVALGAVAAAVWYTTDREAKRSMTEAARARALLGLTVIATPADIRAAHRRLAASAHPDRGGSEADMQALNAARELLLRRAGAWVKRK